MTQFRPKMIVVTGDVGGRGTIRFWAQHHDRERTEIGATCWEDTGSGGMDALMTILRNTAEAFGIPFVDETD